MTRIEKRIFLALTLLSLVLVSRGPASVSGNTIHYLALSHSLVYDRDFDLSNQYAPDGDAIFFPGEADGHTRLGRNGSLYTLHPIGLPIAMAPVYALAAAITSAIPESLLERVRWDRARACRDLLSLAMALLYAWTAILTFRTTNTILPRKQGGTVAVVVAFATPPLICMSILVFPDLPAAWLLALFTYEAVKPEPRRWALALPLALLPWLHVRFALLSAAGVLWLCAKERRQGRSGWASVAASVPAVFLSLAVLGLSSWWMFGSLSLLEDQGLLVGVSGLPGLLLDPDYLLLIVAPFWLVTLAGVASLRHSHLEYLAFAAFSMLSLWFSAGLATEWWEGQSPPARLLVPALPLLVPLLAAGFKRLSGSWHRWPVYAMLAWSFSITIIFLIEPARMWVEPGKGLNLYPSTVISFTETARAEEELEKAEILVNRRNYIARIRKGDIKSVRLFLDAGFSPEAALPEAARHGQAELLALLLESADPTSLSAATALGWAQSKGNSESIQILTEAGVELETRTRLGVTALIRAAEKSRLPVLRALIKAGADVNAATHAGSTALMLSAQSGHQMAVRSLIRAGANPNAKDRDGWTPIMLAARSGEVRIVDILIAEKADVNAVTGLGWTALQWAAYEGHSSVVEALVTAGANVNFESKAGQTALLRAAQKGHTGVVRLLVQYGADVSRTADGMDAKAWAELNGHADVTGALEDTPHRGDGQ